MRTLFGVIAGFAMASSALGAVIDFEDRAAGVGFGCLDIGCSVEFTTPQGFTVRSVTEADGINAVIFDDGPTGNYFVTSGNPFSGVEIEISSTNGKPFSVSSLDVLFFDEFVSRDNRTGQLTFEGLDREGAVVAVEELFPSELRDEAIWLTVAFDDAWASIYTFRVLPQVTIAPQFVIRRELAIDNFAATIVPIPAAAWLFASAVGFISVFRRTLVRKKTGNALQLSKSDVGAFGDAPSLRLRHRP